ncbi:hypothetical protein BDZ97DRAFT_646494 [Flammula alnicola]|nr:hypothetical protein BDZ97DRAFT_646494 [Flammula alnicola]
MSRVLSTNIRWWSIQVHCRQFARLSRRQLQTSTQASSSSTKQTDNPFPYPTHRNPTPHQLFHLPHNATESDIKARYFDLVRLYHPDKVGISTSPDAAHARFQAITAAYDILRGKTPLNDDAMGSRPSATSGARYQTTAAYRTMQKRRQELYDSGAVDDSRKDKLIMIGVVLTILIVLVQTATTRREALAEALTRHRQLSVNIRQTQKQREEERLSQDYTKPSDKT